MHDGMMTLGGELWAQITAGWFLQREDCVQVFAAWFYRTEYFLACIDSEVCFGMEFWHSFINEAPG